MKKSILLAVFGLYAFSLFAQTDKEWTAVSEVLNAQVKAWNAGNIDVFMEGYWQSENLKFIGKTGVQNGWQATIDRYRKNYPDRAAMGTLTFDISHREKLGKDLYFVVGKWHLKREKDEPQGYFSLILKKIKGKWKIIVDHTS